MIKKFLKILPLLLLIASTTNVAWAHGRYGGCDCATGKATKSKYKQECESCCGDWESIFLSCKKWFGKQ
jgi:hypothetical protein